MAEKTAWEHVLGEPVASPPGERPMKAQMDARFDGSFKQFAEWMQETFKNPDDLRVRVIVGNFDLINEVVVQPDPKPSAEALRLAKMPCVQLLPAQAEGVLKELRTLMPTNKIQAIKRLRELTHLGLKEAKDFVESLPPPKDEIPF